MIDVAQKIQNRKLLSPYYAILMAAMCAVLVISNIVAAKTIGLGLEVPFFGELLTDGGAVLFPIAYILGDVFTEVYGFKHARRAILMGFAMAFLAAVTFLIVDLLPGAAFYEYQDDFHNVLGFLPRIVAGSVVGYLVGQFVNSWVMVRLKAKYPNKLVTRLVSSTLAGEILDTILFSVIAFGGQFDSKSMVIFILLGIIYKVSVEVLMLPITTRFIRWLQRKELSLSN